MTIDNVQTNVMIQRKLLFIFKKRIVYLHIIIYRRSICGKQLFRSLRAHQHSSDQMKILKDHSAQTTARIAYIIDI